MESVSDIFIIGGGINGAAIAADAAGRGLTVVLCEMGDLASATSSASTKLIHGGLRYLELFEFNLVRKALNEREILKSRAPHLIYPLEFVLPYEEHLRPAWLIRLGLFLYDHLSKHNSLPTSKSICLENNIRGKALLPNFKKSFSYYDCSTDDARLVIANAISAKENGATILTHTKFISAKKENNLWKILLKNKRSGEESSCYAKALVNAAGPWVKQIQKNITESKSDFTIKLVKGSHIVVPKLYDGEFAYILQNKDKRIVFAIPYQQNFTLIGTTDVSFNSDLENIAIDDHEKKYLCDSINHYFQKKITPNDIIWSYAGVRCLQDTHEINPSKLSRDYQLLIEKNPTAPLITVIGGKITTHRLLAEAVLANIASYFPAMKSSWTADKPLPGGDFKQRDFTAFYHDFKSHYSWLPDNIAIRYAKNYGTRAYVLLENSNSLSDLGEHVAAGLYQKEIQFLIKHEWATTYEDILWRRTKLGLYFSNDDVQKLQELYFK